jgi:hypothetical protein
MVTWSPGPTFYGAAIIDYTLTYDQSTGDFIALAENIADTSYLVSGILTGVSYEFKV